MSDAPQPWKERPAHLHRFVDKRNGRERIYLRVGKGAKIALRAPWGSQALADEAASARSRIKVRPPAAVGSLVGAVRAYRGDTARGIAASADYVILAPSTQVEYDRILDEFERVFIETLLEDIDAGFILDLRDKWAKRGYRAANLRLQVLKNVCKAPRIRGEIEGNPFELIEKVARPHELGEKNPRWFDDEVEAAIEWALKHKLPGLANAVALGRWGGFRKGTIRAVPRRARIMRMAENGQERRIYWLTEKRKVLCDRREDPRLTALLERTEQAARRGKKAANIVPHTIAFNSRGEAYTSRALGHAFERMVEALAKEGKTRNSLTPHGLRHARGVEIASAGGSDAQIMAQLDHASPRQAAEYRRQAERLKLADDAQDRVDAEVVKLNTKRRAAGENGG